MKSVVIASTNPVKINAVKEGFAAMFPNEYFSFDGAGVQSGVRDQPLSDDETFLGARNRVQAISASHPDANYCVGLEGGIEAKGDDMEAFAWIVVRNNSGLEGKGKTGIFFLPPPVAKLIHEGKELGVADDIVFGRSNSKQENGAVGLLTGDSITRTGYYTQAVIFALIPFKNTELYI